MRLISIDLGKKGAIATFGLEGHKLALESVQDTPMLGKEYNLHAIRELIKVAHPDIAVLERAATFQGEGVVTARSVGFGEGMWKAMLCALDVRFEEMSAASWTAALKIPKTERKDKPSVHVALACQLFPEFAGEFYSARGALKDGRADAVLIGEAFFRKNYRILEAS